MDFGIGPEVFVSEKGSGEDLIEVIGDVLGGHNVCVDNHLFIDV